VYIHEIIDSIDSFSGKSVRVFGKLIEYDVVNGLAIIQYKEKKLVVDTALLDSFVYKIGSVFQFVGETRSTNKVPRLYARLGRNIDDMDLRLFEQALTLRRKFLKAAVVDANEESKSTK